MPYASGKDAWGISDRSGRRYRLREMMVEWTGAKGGPDEFDSNETQDQKQALPLRELCSGAGIQSGLTIYRDFLPQIT